MVPPMNDTARMLPTKRTATIINLGGGKSRLYVYLGMSSRAQVVTSDEMPTTKAAALLTRYKRKCAAAGFGVFRLC